VDVAVNIRTFLPRINPEANYGFVTKRFHKSDIQEAMKGPADILP
jgi:hypothetical protein